MKFPLPAFIALVIATTPAAALEQTCRFIQAKADRETCYKRQDEELAAKRKSAAPATDESRTLESLRQMRQDDEAVYRSLHSICLGC